MPVNLTVPAQIHPIPGVTLAAVSAGLKSNGDLDLVLIALSPECTSAGVFTRNAYCAAPVTLCREHLQQNDNRVRALLINSGGANAATGKVGYDNAKHTCEWVADLLGVSTESVMPFSTGVIGEQLPMEKMRAGIDTVSRKLASSPAAWLDAAHGIMTTDVLPKIVSKTIELGGRRVTLSGFAKGSGMIQPDMATMLAYLFTDAAVNSADLQTCLADTVERTFNSVTVDGDTSTNDSCMLTATGQSGVSLTPRSPEWSTFCDAVHALSLELAQAIVRDGEGATKFITININGGKSVSECKQVGLTVGNSPLVKTAFFASDANLGRIIMAIGRSGINDLDINTLTLKLGDVDVLSHGQPAESYTDERGQAVMQEQEINVSIDLGRGTASWSVWTCDLSHEYVSINADYRS